MGLIELIVTVCALSLPSQCEDQHFSFLADMSLIQCVMSAPPYIAQWINEHPKWVDPPFFDDLACLGEVREQLLVEALVTQSAAEAFHEPILHRFAGGDVVPFDVMLLLPGQDGI